MVKIFGVKPAEEEQKKTQLTPEDWVNLVIINGSRARASDIHFEPEHHKFFVRYRVDGILQKVEEHTVEFYEMVVARIKVLGQLNITERFRPQEGHASISPPELNGEVIDFRISIFPTVFGEAIVLRLTGRKELIFDNFEAMGMRPDNAELLGSMIRRSHGMILINGPAGSGKTATLYTALNQIRSSGKNIITLEDPVEYSLPQVRQAQINLDMGFTFASGMRSILRQDPDVIMIGEIRDRDTAEIAVRAALTGRLVFSTVHTNDSFGVVTRLLEFGIVPSLVASALLLSLSKRLVRKNCVSCSGPYTPSSKVIKEFGLESLVGTQFYRGAGCDVCSQKGYFGRIAIFEFFAPDHEISNLIIEGASIDQIREATRRKGTKTLLEEALRLAEARETTLEEALNATV